MENDFEQVGTIIRALRSYGVELFVDKGVVHGRMLEGRKFPYGARVWSDRLQMLNEAAVAYLQKEQALYGLSAAEMTDRLRPLIETRKAENVTVYYSPSTGRTDAFFMEVENDEDNPFGE